MIQHDGPACIICNHPKKREIETHVTKGTMKYEAMSVKYGVCPSSISKHKHNHMKEKVAKALKEQEREEVEDGLNILKCAKEIYDMGMASATEAKQKGLYSSVGSSLKPCVSVLELLKCDAPKTNVVPIDATEQDIDARLTEYLTIISETKRSECR